jgi:hypothetical protein
MIVLRVRNGCYEMADEIIRAKGPSTVEVTRHNKELREWIDELKKAITEPELNEQPQG